MNSDRQNKNTLCSFHSILLASADTNAAFSVALCALQLNNVCLWHLFTWSNRRIVQFVSTKHRKQNYLPINGLSFRLGHIYAFAYTQHDGRRRWELTVMGNETLSIATDGRTQTIYLMESFLLLKSAMNFSEISFDLCDLSTMTDAENPAYFIHDGQMWIGRRWTGDVSRINSNAHNFIMFHMLDWLRSFISIHNFFSSTCSFIYIGRISFQCQTSFSYSWVFSDESVRDLPERKKLQQRKKKNCRNKKPAHCDKQ